MKVAYNNTYGGFSLTKDETEYLNKLREEKGLNRSSGIPRHDELLIKTIERSRELHGKLYHLDIIEIDDRYSDCYVIDEYDGMESVICDPANLIFSKLKKAEIEKMSNEECKIFLGELKKIVIEENVECD